MTRLSRSKDSLADLAIFAECGKDELRKVHKLLSTVDVPSGQVLMQQGTVGREFLIVASGLVAVTRNADQPDGELVTLVGEGQVLGELALLNGTSRSATVITLAPTTVYAANRSEFFSLLNASPSAAARIEEAARERNRANLAA